MTMRKFINDVQLLESIVFRDQFVQQGHSRKTIVAINPSKAEWQANFPRGAAGVICRDGNVVVGDGDVLAHDVILDLASVDQNKEKYRLQLCTNVAWAELWIDEDLAETKDYDEIDEYCSQQYGGTIAEIEAEMHEILGVFMPGAKFKAIPMNSDNADVVFPDDDLFRSQCAS